MLSQSSLIAFAATANAEAARHFYQDILELQLIEDSPFALAFDAHGTHLRVQKVEKVIVAGYTVLGWEVKDIKLTAKMLQNKGIMFEQFPGLEQDESGIWSSPSGAKIAWFKDPAGNLLSLTQYA